MSDTLTVAVLMGGMSEEHEISLLSGQGVVKALESTGISVIPIVIAKDGPWQFPEEAPCDIFAALPKLQACAVDCVFIALHGTFGEDGRIQALPDLLSIPHTGSGCAASALGLDKIRSKVVVSGEEIPVADQAEFTRPEWDVDQAAITEVVTEELGFPCVVKAVSQGSSVGISIPQRVEDFAAAVEVAFEVDTRVMVEGYITGVEVTCGVLDVVPSEMPHALPVTEIRPVSADWFDYEAKYQAGATEEITPAEIDPEMAILVQECAIRAHQAIGCKGWSRSDFIIDEDGPIWIEINTVPGLTPTSLYPQACAAEGISYAEMCRMFVDAAIKNTK